MATFDEYQAMSWDDRKKVSVLDCSGCNFKGTNISGLCWLAENLSEVILSDTILDPSCLVYELDSNGETRYVLGDGNTPSQAYENRYPIMTSFARASDQERRSYLRIKTNAKMTIVKHGSRGWESKR